MAKRTTSLQDLSNKSKEIASMASDAIGQAALRVTHMALKRARAVVASADETIYPAKRAKAKAKKAKAAKKAKPVKKAIAKASSVKRKVKARGKAIVKKAKRIVRKAR